MILLLTHNIILIGDREMSQHMRFCYLFHVHKSFGSGVVLDCINF